MRNRKTQGFTLIELLIVIAIIGILAAVLIPNLMNARTTAAQRAVQAHSSSVYTAMVAALAEDMRATAANILPSSNAAGGDECNVTAQTPVQNNVSGTAVNTPYSFNAAPGGLTSCDIIVVGTSDFDVVAEYGTSGTAQFRQYTNGQDTTPAP